MAVNFEMRFVVPGVVVPKKRPRVVRVRGKSMAFTPDETVVYENLVKSRADDAMKKYGLSLTTGPLRAEVSITVPIPTSWPKKLQEGARTGAIAPISRPDLDNCVKSIFDGMNGVVYKDDGQVVAFSVHKLYGDEPQTLVKVFATGQGTAR
jgi:Holliday junction resolvase RusA-like endonuclease